MVGGASGRTTTRRGGSGRFFKPCWSRSLISYVPDASAGTATVADFPPGPTVAATVRASIFDSSALVNAGHAISTVATGAAVVTVKMIRLSSIASIRAALRASTAGNLV